MDTARKCLLLAAVGLTACGSTSRPKVHVAAGACPTPDAEALAKAADEKRFELGRPELPEYLDCLRWPMTALRKISSGFMDPDHGYTPGRHDGTDLPAPVGTDVLASAGGEVLWTREVEACQDAAVAVRFADGWVFAVHHLSRVDVSKGEKVVPGQRLGLSGGAVNAPGSGPWTTGPHLHFILAHQGAYVDAERYFCP